MELKSCPFCGERAVVKSIHSSGGGRGEWVKVLCENCRVQTHWADSEEEALRVWNSRCSDE